MGIRGLAAGAALSVALSAFGMSAANAGETSRPKSTAEAEDNKRVCKNLTYTGTRLSQRTCKRKSEWALDAERARKQLNELQTKGLRSNIDGP